jgi:hypothetical protein
MRLVLSRRLAAIVMLGALISACGAASQSNPRLDSAFLDAVHNQAPDIGGYRSNAQLLSMGQAICADLGSGASVQEVGDRVPLVEGNVALSPEDLGEVITAAINELCPKYRHLLSE